MSSEKNSNEVLQPIDTFIKAAFEEKIRNTFLCKTVFTTGVDEVRSLQYQQGNKQPEYPYIFLTITSVASSMDRYNFNSPSRIGIPVTKTIDGNRFLTARFLPVNFLVDVKYITNKYSSIDAGSIEWFIRRWNFSRRNGSLSFNVNYGQIVMSINYSLGEDISIPTREDQTQNEAVYKLTSSATIFGFVSEPETGISGRVNQIATDFPEDFHVKGTYVPFSKGQI